jgi:hypothetical protein
LLGAYQSIDPITPFYGNMTGAIGALAIIGKLPKWLLARWEKEALQEINPRGNKQWTNPLLN